MARLCTSCGSSFNSLNPLRKLCDECQEKRSNPLVLLAIADGELEANIWADILRQAGIAAITRDDPSFRGQVPGTSQPFSTEVLVNLHDLERARELLNLDNR